MSIPVAFPNAEICTPLACFPFSPLGRRCPEGSDEGASEPYFAGGSPSSRCRDLLPAGEKGAGGTR